MNSLAVGAVAGAICGPLAVLLVILFVSRRLPAEKCPSCGTPSSNTRSLADVRRGYRICQQCGCRIDPRGEKVDAA